MQGIDPSDVPHPFLCPISLDLILDPVILHTGHSYDRKSIQKWLDAGHKTCPITMQKLSDLLLTPNHVLRRLIREWVEKSSLQQKKQHAEVLEGLVNSLQQSSKLESADKLREMRLTLGKNEFAERRFMVDAGGAARLCALLVSMLMKPDVNEDISLEIIFILVQLRLDLRAKKDLRGANICVRRLLDFLHHGEIEARRNAAKLLASLDTSGLMRFESGRVESGLRCLLHERSTMGEGLILLKEMVINSSDNKDMVKRWVMEKGFVATVVELLPSLISTQSCEVALEIMSKISSNYGGGAEAGVPTDLWITTPTILSNLTAVFMKATDKSTLHAAVMLLASLFKRSYGHDTYAHNCSDYDHNYGVNLLMGGADHHLNFSNPGLPRRLLLVLQSNCTPVVKKHCAELLKLLAHRARQVGPLANFTVSYETTTLTLLY